MKIMLTSFGLGHEYLPDPTDIPRQFDRLPPLNMRSAVGRFEPEYSLLILCDKIILDELSFERLKENRQPIFAAMAQTIKALHDEGYVELADYSSALRGNVDLLRKMTDIDIRSIGQWRQPLQISEEIWRRYVRRTLPYRGSARVYRRLTGSAPEPGHLPVTHAVADFSLEEDRYQRYLSIHRRPTYSIHRRPTDDFIVPIEDRRLKAYLTFINSNLILSNEMDSALHDWEDFLPFYQQKFLGVGRRNPPAAAQAEASRQLFDVVLPELAIDSPQQLIRILKHRRIGELRALIDAAGRGEVEFDADFARNAFREVFGIEKRVAKGRRIIGYVTLPIGFIPLVGSFAQTIVQEAAGTLLEQRLRKPYRWLYMLSDLPNQPRHKRSP
jgi:hypothetical protein